MKNINQLRTELVSVFQGLREGSIQAKEASEMNNTAGKIINTLKVELEYATLQNRVPEIPFLNADRKP